MFQLFKEQSIIMHITNNTPGRGGTVMITMQDGRDDGRI